MVATSENSVKSRPDSTTGPTTESGNTALTITKPVDLTRDVQLFCIHHRVSRYGQFYDFVIEDFQSNYYALDPSLATETLYDLLRVNHGDKVTLKANRETHFKTITDMESVDYNTRPLCQCCGGYIGEVLDGLVCLNPGCSGRGKSRVYYFLQGLNVFRDPGDISTFVSECIVDLKEELTIFNAVYALCSCLDGKFEDGRKAIKSVILNTKNALIKLGETRRPDFAEAVIVSEFIDKLSLPSITARDISDTIITATGRGESMYILSMLGDTMDSRGVDNSQWFKEELARLEELFLLQDFPKERDDEPYIERDVDAWF